MEFANAHQEEPESMESANNNAQLMRFSSEEFANVKLVRQELMESAKFKNLNVYQLKLKSEDYASAQQARSTLLQELDVLEVLHANLLKS